MGIALALGASLTWGLADFFGPLQGRTLGALRALVWVQIGGLVAIAVIVAVRGEGPKDALALLAIPAAVSGTLGLFAYYRGVAVGAVSIVAPIAGISAVLPVIVGIISGDRPSAWQLLGIAAALAIQEPRALFNPLALQTVARSRNGGYLLDGVKSLVPRARDAEVFVIAAELEGRGPALFIVESSTPGISVEPEPAMGIRAAGTGRLILEGVQAALLGEGDPGVYRECVQLGRLGWCALAVGAGQAVLDYVIPYVKDRTAFGEPISNRQAVAFGVANIGIELEGMRLATYRAAGRVDQDRPFAREVALARRLCAERGMAIGSDGVQLLGGHGYVKEHPVERWYRDLRAAGLMEGALLV